MKAIAALSAAALVAVMMVSPVMADHRDVHPANPEQLETRSWVQQLSVDLRYKAGWYEADPSADEEDNRDCFSDRHTRQGFGDGEVHYFQSGRMYHDLGIWGVETLPTGTPETQDPGVAEGGDCLPFYQTGERPAQVIGTTDTTMTTTWFVDLASSTYSFSSDEHWVYNTDKKDKLRWNLLVCEPSDDVITFNAGTYGNLVYGALSKSVSIVGDNAGGDCTVLDYTSLVRPSASGATVSTTVDLVDMNDVVAAAGAGESAFVVSCLTFPVKWKGVDADNAVFTAHDWFTLVSNTGGVPDQGAIAWASQPRHLWTLQGDNGCPDGTPWAAEVSDYDELFI